MYLAYGADLRHEFGKQLLGEALVDVADVYGRIFVLFPSLRVSKSASEDPRSATMGKSRFATYQCFDMMKRVP